MVRLLFFPDRGYVPPGEPGFENAAALALQGDPPGDQNLELIITETEGLIGRLPRGVHQLGVHNVTLAVHGVRKSIAAKCFEAVYGPYQWHVFEDLEDLVALQKSLQDGSASI